MGRRHLQQGVEKDIFGGDWPTILGILEDIHRAADGVAPRLMLKTGPEVPYLGGRTSLPSPPVSPRPRGALLMATPFNEIVKDSSMADEEDMVRYGDDSLLTNVTENNSRVVDANPLGRGRALDIVPRVMEPVRDGEGEGEVGEVDEGLSQVETVFGYRQHGGDRLGTSEEDGDLYPILQGEQSLVESKTEDLVPIGWGLESLEGKSPMSSSFGGPVMGVREVDKTGHEVKQETVALPSRRAPPAPAVQDSTNCLIMESFLSDGSASPIPTPREELPQSPYSSPHHQGEGSGSQVTRQRLLELESLVAWMGDLNVTVKEPDKLVLNDKAPEFADGVILAELVERLEHFKGFDGINRKPKARATKLQNIRRVLNVLQNKQVCMRTER